MTHSIVRPFWRPLLFALAFALFATSVIAKRVPPKPVTPVVSGGIRYSAEGDGRDQYVIAEDASSGEQMWRIKVFHNRIKSWIEEDVQWVFITDLKLIDSSLIVRDERSRCYAVNLTKRHVKKRTCEGAF
jgi:hypothetical protein